MNSDQIKAVIASYWRYVRQYPVVALETDPNLHAFAGELADVIAVSKDRYLVETEVKINLADLRRDVKKLKHKDYSGGRGNYIARYFYFAVPRDIANDAKVICEELYPYAGILGTNGLSEYDVVVYRNPKLLAGKRLTFPQVLRLVYSQSGTVCRLSRKVEELVRVQDNLQCQLKEYRDRERL